MSRLTIALDMMGGDHGPPVTVNAAVRAVTDSPNLQLLLCGDRPQLEEQLKNYSNYPEEALILVHTEQVVTMDDKPSSALRNKPRSSMRKALELVQSGEADACVSAGNTGALLAMAYYELKTLPGIDRPALISSVPAQNHKKVFLLDLGANVSCDSEILFQYAVMGSVMAEEVEGIAQPKVGLLNVGEEQIKGNDVVKHTGQILSSLPSLNYIGYIEGGDIFSNKADVVVTDGFVGNVALKACEGLGKFIISEVKRLSQKNLFTRLMARLSLPLLKKIYNRVNPDQYNGASLIGLRGIVVKSHGNASSDAFLYAIQEAVHEVDRQVPTKIKDKIERLLMERP
ncbi:Glycerol-3-phosphate 1-O-acyltransferase [Saliniradius amylolyticus]|uniref:Phosphate acyltransferase n=1 Tax=Saliniradius amylolyticus TaxID=2183582 RepID=A0A2S2E4W3_9ALTE|nr:phosphate acyltransferase PlsX [Saliniradius amylolyticus]AWL12027.1 Glycerol-3-phosphate 1-O-acyltransferase [Saliniradius amylolyticus]